MEGTHSDCPSRNHAFTFHIGGFRGAYCPVQRLSFGLSPKAHHTIQLDVEQLLNLADVTTLYHIMSPNQTAMDFAAYFSRIFLMPQP